MRSMPSAVDAAKRALVTLVRTLAATYGVVVDVGRDSSDRDLTASVRRVALRAHPDRGGSARDQQRLNDARAERGSAFLRFPFPSGVSPTICHERSTLKSAAV